MRLKEAISDFRKRQEIKRWHNAAKTLGPRSAIVSFLQEADTLCRTKADLVQDVARSLKVSQELISDRYFQELRQTGTIFQKDDAICLEKQYTK